MILSFLPLLLCWKKISKLGDLVRNDDDYDDENLVFTWVGSWVQAMERLFLLEGACMHRAMPSQTDTAI